MKHVFCFNTIKSNTTNKKASCWHFSRERLGSLFIDFLFEISTL